MKRRVLAVLLGGIVTTTMILSGCSSGKEPAVNQETKGVTTKTEDETKTGKETKAEEKGGAVTETTLTVFDAMAYGTERYAKVIEKFEQDHPGVTVEVQHAPNDFDALLKARFSSDDIPDVFAVQTGTVANSYYEFAYDWTNEKDTLALFNDDAINTGKDLDGNVKSLPWSYENMGFLYNKELFEKAGITELPATMSQLEETCKKLKSAGITAFALAAKEPWVLNQVTTHYMMDKKIDASGVVKSINNGELTYEDMENYKNLFKLLDLAVEYGPEKPLEVDWETSENMLANGQAAIIHMGDWCQATLDEFNKDAKLGFLPAPVSENPEDATLLSSISWTYIANKDSKNVELAKEYVKYILTSEEGLDWICNSVGSVPAAKGDHKVAGALANEAAGYISEGKTNGWIHTLMPPGYQDQIGPVIQNYMLGQASMEDTIQQVQELWTN